jgi:molybdenum cofactor cytidylyltransferase
VYTTGLVLAAGGSVRLGHAKQLLPYRGRTLLDATLDMARRCSFDQLVVALGGDRGEIRAAVDLEGCDVVDNEHFTTGCASSIVAAMEAVDSRASSLVLLLGDQPGVQPSVVSSLAATSREAGADVGVCRYDDGLGHPFWLARTTFESLQRLHGDKAVWKLIDSGVWRVHEMAVSGGSPPDVDTWDDYQRLVAAGDPAP